MASRHKGLNLLNSLPYFSDYKTHFPHPVWEENGGASYSLNLAYIYIGEILCDLLLNILPHFLLQIFFSYFPPLKLRCILWSKKYGDYLTYLCNYLLK